ncbi:MAG: 4Fe-4S dicluster domain-containing protein [Marinilabiliaceae bacterium]|nr:4Fe-4S dicluster domain-containing protein [Marinilabiliaceae bacterium]
MLKKVRIALATLMFIAAFVLFLDYTGTVHDYLGWVAKVQFMPAILAMNFLIVALLVILTLLFGRLYCSVICPLGIMQDIIAKIGAYNKRRRYRFFYSKGKNILRIVMMLIFIVCMALGVLSIGPLLEPYSIFGRIVNSLFQPLYSWTCNGLAMLENRFEMYNIYGNEVWLKSGSMLVVAIVSLIAIGYLAWRNGRTYCNTICPVGTILGFLSKKSLFAIQIDLTKCAHCGMCEKQCKAACLSSKEKKIDYSRCVVCMDCIDDCKHNAISYSMRRFSKKEGSPEPKDPEKRAFATTALFVAGAAVASAQHKTVDGGLATLENKQVPPRKITPVPAGAKSIKHLSDHCTACQLCVSACPNHVLVPSSELSTFMQPRMTFEHGYCRVGCTLCSEVCPNGAIAKIKREEKTAIKVGHAVWIKENCIVVDKGQKCGNCAHHCPSHAIEMVPLNGDEKLKIPVVNAEKCIGCGACENLCPSRPISAIYVEGYDNQIIS